MRREQRLRCIWACALNYVEKALADQISRYRIDFRRREGARHQLAGSGRKTEKPDVMVYSGPFSGPRDLVFLLPLYALLILFIIWNTIRRTRRLVKNAVETYELTINERQIMRVQRECPTMVILRNEVSSAESLQSGGKWNVHAAGRWP